MKLLRINTTLGFSLVEVMVVVGITALLSVAVLLSFGAVRPKIDLNDARITVVSALEKARNRAAAGAGEGEQSVHVMTASVVSFEGGTYVAGEGDEDPLPTTVTSNLSGTDVVFSRLSGTPKDAPVSIVLTHTSGKFITVNVSENGAVTVE
jgi:type II secretory pathway pseudopilin PulG